MTKPPPLTAAPDTSDLRSPKLHLPPTGTIVSAIAIIFLLFAFFTGKTFQFYASALFLFYSLTKVMWVSVIMLGVFQTLIMIPLRMINLKVSDTLKEFEDKIQQVQDYKQQRILIKKNLSKGNPAILWFTINFFIQTISYLSLGRLFLIDFYSKALNPKLLYSFVSYPDYPIRGTIFKIPYITFPKTHDYGLPTLLLVWLIIIVVRAVIRRLMVRVKKSTPQNTQPTPVTQASSKIIGFLNGSFVLLLLLSWLVIRHFPQSINLDIFSGDVSRPNYTLNAITAVGAFSIVIWLNLSKITKKGEIARSQQVPQNIIDQTQRDMFKDAIRSASVIGVGAYFVTRQIPSAFELSIFTLEIISFLAPFTIDRVMLARISSKKSAPDPKPLNPKVDTKAETS